MKILALEKETPTATADQFQPQLKEEAQRVWDLQQTGLVREIYFTAEDHTAVLVLECADADSARKILADLPLVKAGLIEFEVIPLVPYDGFARLFEHSDETSFAGENSHGSIL